MHASPQWLLVLTLLIAQQSSLLLQDEGESAVGGNAAAGPAAVQAPVAELMPGDALVVEGDAVVGDGNPPAPPGIAVEPQNPILSFFENPINLILISAILFLFIVVRPQQRQAKDQQKLLAGLKKNDRVVTSGGIHGTVTQVADGEAVVVVRIDDNSGAKMTINRDSITKVVTSETKE